jgi:predicted Zn-dependent protease
MESSDEAIRNLQEAVRQSPDNVPLRLHFAEMLMDRGFAECAETEYREALKRAPENPQLKAGLATALYQQGKNAADLVLVDCPNCGKSVEVPDKPESLNWVARANRLRATTGPITAASKSSESLPSNLAPYRECGHVVSLGKVGS